MRNHYKVQSMKKWNIGIVGAGVIAGFHAKAIADLSNAQLCCVFDINEVSANKFASEYGCKAYSSLETMLDIEKLEILTIATPSGLHMEAAIEAARRGVNCIIEKPLEITTQRIMKIIKASETAGTKLGCFFQTRYAKALDPLRLAVKNGSFGKITFAGVYVPWWRSDEYYNGSWHGTWKFDGGGALMNQAIHMIDTLCELMPEIESVQAFTNSIGHPGIEAEDTAVAALKFRDGALGLIHGSTAAYPGQPKRLEIMGTQGTVVYLEDSYTVFDFKDKTTDDDRVLKEFGQIAYKCGSSDPKAIAHDLHTVCLKDFIDSIENKKEFKINGYEAAKSVKLIESIYQSAREGRIVEL